MKAIDNLENCCQIGGWGEKREGDAEWNGLSGVGMEMKKFVCAKRN